MEDPTVSLTRDEIYALLLAGVEIDAGGMIEWNQEQEQALSRALVKLQRALNAKEPK